MASASPSASVPEVESMMVQVALECGGDISASQEYILANSSFLGGDNDLSAAAAHEKKKKKKGEEEEEEVFSTPPLTQQDPITMCTLPFTPSQSPSDKDDDDDLPLVKPRRRPRVCVRKVRGARIRTPTPSPKQQQQPQEQLHVDPLYRAVLMIPTTTQQKNPLEDFLALARQRGIF